MGLICNELARDPTRASTSMRGCRHAWTTRSRARTARPRGGVHQTRSAPRRRAELGHRGRERACSGEEARPSERDEREDGEEADERGRPGATPAPRDHGEVEHPRRSSRRAAKLDLATNERARAGWRGRAIATSARLATPASVTPRTARLRRQRRRVWRKSPAREAEQMEMEPAGKPHGAGTICNGGGTWQATAVSAAGGALENFGRFERAYRKRGRKR